jgi:hypothetical protein
MVVKLPLRVRASGFLTLGPRPGTPEFAEEQAARAEGRPYDYSNGRKLYVQDEEEEAPPTLRAVAADPDECPPPVEGYQGV